MPTLTNATMSSDTNHRTILKHIDADGSRRHSPSASESGDGGLMKPPEPCSPGGSPKPGSQAMFGPSTGQSAASPHSAKFGHRSRNSTDSVSSNAAIYGSGVPPEASRLNLGEMIMGTRPQ